MKEFQWNTSIWSFFTKRICKFQENVILGKSIFCISIIHFNHAFYQNLETILMEFHHLIMTKLRWILKLHRFSSTNQQLENVVVIEIAWIENLSKWETTENTVINRHKQSPHRLLLIELHYFDTCPWTSDENIQFIFSIVRKLSGWFFAELISNKCRK